MTTEVYRALSFKVSLAYLVSNPLKIRLKRVGRNVTLLTNKVYQVFSGSRALVRSHLRRKSVFCQLTAKAVSKTF